VKAEGRKVWVCFAVKEEARAFQRMLAERGGVEVLIVGVGRRNAEKAIRDALERERPGLVLTCGFAGGLDPDLAAGTVVFDCDAEARLEAALLAAGAKPVQFHCAERVATSAAEKQALREATGADAVEMESEAVRTVCQELKTPSATVRVILDTAQDDLPLDFNQLMTPDLRLDSGKLALALLKAPSKVGALRRLQQLGNVCADNLAKVLGTIIAA